MGRWRASIIASWLFLAPAAAFAADVSFTVENPKFPSPFVTSVLGLTLTAVAVVGGRACVRSPNTMMYMVLGCIALTAVMVSYSARVHDNFYRAGMAKLAEFERSQPADKTK
jgi:hypothetical protein